MARQTIQNSNASLYFNGVAHADTASNSTLSLANGFTVAGWIKISKFITASTRQKMIATANWGFGATSTTQKLSFTTIGVKDYDSTGSSIQPGTWVFACAVLDSSNDVTFYLNGQPDSVVTGTNPATTTAGVTSLGQRPTPTDRHIGNLSGVRVFNRELTAQEILSLYNGTVPSGVIAEYLLTEGAGTVAYDTSGNGNNGTITSGTWTRDTPTKTRKLVNNNLVYNGDFEIAPQVNVPTTTQFRWIDGTAAGVSSPINIFGWGLQTGSATATALFDSTVSHSGNYSLKLSATATASSVKVSNKANSSYFGSMSPVLPSTSYTISGWYKTSVTSGTATTGVMVQAIGKINEDNNEDVTYTAVSGVKTTTDWTYFTYTFTTDSNINYIKTAFRINNDGAATLIMDAWFDDIQLYPTTPVTRNVATGRSIATGRSAA